MSNKISTIRDYRERINRVIFYLENHLGDNLILEDLAKVAFFSPYHFHRIFSAFTGERLGDFVRRLRLERAAQHLLYLDKSITEIGLETGYDTPSAFGRSFLKHFGVTPSEYRNQCMPNRIFGAKPLNLTTETEELTMNPEMKTIDPMTVLFVRRTGPYYQAAGEAFGVLCQFAGPRRLLGPSSRMIGISHDDPNVTEESKFRYDACVTIDRDVKAEGEVAKKTIAGGKYAVFLHAGSYDRFQQTYDQIFKVWLPDSGKKLREEPCFELYLNSPDQVKPEDLRTEIWLPIQ